MAFSLSPAVTVKEEDRTIGVPAVATSIGAFAGDFSWGPSNDVTQVSNELDLVARFGKPSNRTFASFFSASNFLAYSTNLLVSRISTAGQLNAVASGTAVKIANENDYDTNFSNGEATVGMFSAKYSGLLGNSLRVSICDAESFSRPLTGTVSLTDGSTSVVGVGTAFTTEVAVGDLIEVVAGGVRQRRKVVSIASATSLTVDSGFTIRVRSALTGTVAVSSGSPVVVGTGTLFTTEVAVGDKIELVLNGNVVTKTVVSIATATSLTVDSNYVVSASGLSAVKIDVTETGLPAVAFWEYFESFGVAPVDSLQAIQAGSSNDGLHIAVVDEDGLFGQAGTVLETFENASKAVNALADDGSSGYYKNVLRNSQYIYWMDHPEASDLSVSGLDFGATTATGSFKTLNKPLSYSLVGGADGAIPTPGETQLAFDVFADDQKFDVSLIITGKVNADVGRYIINNIAEVRKDCVAFLSPVDASNNTVIVGDTAESIEKIVAYRNAVGISSSYGFMDSGYKYQYDKYNDVFRWVPLNGDIAGLCARTDFTNDPWFSPAGFNRGQIKNVSKLAVNPNKSQRDELFKNNVNPVVFFPGQGTVLFGDKTLLARPSAFDAINVRRLFIVLEKSIATAAKFFLFEQNTEGTRQLFANLVNPFLRDVQGREGITEFFVDIGPLVNTPDVIDANTFRANIYIKPVRSIRFIELTFIATRSSVSFSELTQ